MASFTNQAILSYNGRSIPSNVVTGQVVSPLTVTKTPVVDSYSANDTVTYVVSIVNAGSTCYDNLTLSDDLGAYAAAGQTVYPLSYTDGSAAWFINGTPQSAPAVTAGPPLVISGISVPAGGNAMVIYEAAVTAAAPLAAGSEVTNTVTVSGAGLGTPLTAQAVITVTDEADLSISKALSPATVEENGQLTYTFVVRNSGNSPAEADANLVITDTFDPVLKNLAVTMNGEPMAARAGYTYDAVSGVFATVAGQITVPAATFSQSTVTGDWQVAPGETTITITGTV